MISTPAEPANGSPNSGRSLPEAVYTPSSELRHPLAFAASLIRDLVASRDLAVRLAIRDVSALYRQSLLGYVWAFIPPLVVALPFVFLRSGEVLSMGETPIPYAVYAVSGMVLWQTFTDAVRSPLRVVSTSRSMLVKIRFPREALILAGVLVTAFSTLVRMVVLIPVLALGGVTPGWECVIFPLTLVALILLGLSVGLLLTPLGALYKDVELTLGVFFTGWMLVTPVVYPAPTSGPAAALIAFNPVSALLTTARATVTGLPLDQWTAALATTGGAVGALLIGWVFYRIAFPHVVARLGM